MCKKSLSNTDRPTVIVDQGISDISTRRPYYRMRGKPVTTEQAFEIIRRTDRFFADNRVLPCSQLQCLDYEEECREFHDLGMMSPINCPGGFCITCVGEKCSNYIGSINFDNWLICKNHYPFGYGWIHTDGTVGANGITQKFPTAAEFIQEWTTLISAFPYLDLVIAVTWWDEVPPYIGKLPPDVDDPKYDNNFLDAIIMGIYVHDNTVEIMNPERTREKYLEYAALYEDRNRDKYRADYYDERGIIQVDEAYLRRCIEGYGLNAEEELSKIPERTRKVF